MVRAHRHAQETYVCSPEVGKEHEVEMGNKPDQDNQQVSNGEFPFGGAIPLVSEEQHDQRNDAGTGDPPPASHDTQGAQKCDFDSMSDKEELFGRRELVERVPGPHHEGLVGTLAFDGGLISQSHGQYKAIGEIEESEGCQNDDGQPHGIPLDAMGSACF